MLRLALAWQLVRAQVPEPPDLPIAGVQWNAPPDCPGRADLLRAIDRRLGREFAPDELALDARVVRGDSRFTLRLRVVVGERSERRELTAETCTALVDATALLVIHTLAEAAEVARATPAAELADKPAEVVTTTSIDLPVTQPLAAPPEIATPPAARPAPPAPRPRGPGVLLRVHGGPALGASPRLTGLAGLAVGLLWPRLRLEARASFLGPRSGVCDDTEITTLLLAGSVHACLRLGRGALELPVCAGLEAGGMRGAARGPRADAAGFMPWFGAVLGVGAAWRVRPRLALWSALEAVGGLVRPSFVLRDPGPDVALFRPFPVSGRLLVGLELRLGDPR